MALQHNLWFEKQGKIQSNGNVDQNRFDDHCLAGPYPIRYERPLAGATIRQLPATKLYRSKDPRLRTTCIRFHENLQILIAFFWVSGGAKESVAGAAQCSLCFTVEGPGQRAPSLKRTALEIRLEENMAAH
ncbi:hypothetical protein MHYP_G00278270 [Metynnis hypsauchen]